MYKRQGYSYIKVTREDWPRLSFTLQKAVSYTHLYKVAKDFCAKVSERAMGQEVMESLTPAQQVVKIVNAEHDHVLTLVLEVQAGGLAAAHQSHQLFVDDFDHLLGRGQALHDLLAHGCLLYTSRCV